VAQVGVGVPVEQADTSHDSSPALLGEGDGKLDHVGGLDVAELGVVTLVRVDFEDVHGHVNGLLANLLGHADDRNSRHAVDLVLLLEVGGDGDLLGTIIRVGEHGLGAVHVDELIDGPLGRLLGVSRGDADTLELAEVLLEVRVPPVAKGSLVQGGVLGRAAVEHLTDSTSELLRAPEGTVSDVDVDRERLLELVVEDWTKGGEDTLEGLYTTAKVEALLAALEEGLLDLGVLLGRPLAHDMVEEVDSVDAFGGPRGLTLEEVVQVGEVDLASPADVEGVLVATSAFLGGTTLLGVEVDGDTGVIAVKLLAGPCQLVAVADPEVGGLTEGGLDRAGVPDLAEEDALGVVDSVAGVVELGRLVGVKTGAEGRLTSYWWTRV
jgi:hypothetical protein